MFKRLLFAALLCIAAAPALAQNTTCATRPVGDSSNACASTAFVQNQVATYARIKLMSPLSMYVNPNSGSTSPCGAAGAETCAAGSNSNTCLSAGQACLTLSYAAALFGRSYDLGGISGHKIYVAHAANWRENVVLPYYMGEQPGSHNNVVIEGDSASPTSLVLDPVSGDCISAIGNYSEWGVAYFKIICTGSSLRADYQSMITHNGMIFGSANFPLQATGDGAIIEGTPQGGANSGTVFNGNVNSFESVSNGGLIIWNGVTVTISGAPACASACMNINPGGIIDNSGATFSGSATGIKFQWYAGGVFTTSVGPSGDPNGVTPGNVQGNAPTFAVITGATYTNILAQMGSALYISGRATDGTDANVIMTAASCPWLVNTANLTGARTWTLPLASTLPAGTTCTQTDAGGITGANTITLQRSGGDFFSGNGTTANTYVLPVVGASATEKTDGITGWYLISHQ